MIIVSGGIDLSVGAIIALSTVVIAWFLRAGWPPSVAALCGIFTGVVCGVLNEPSSPSCAWCRSSSRWGPCLIVRGAAKGIAHEQKIDAPITWLNDLLARLPPDRARLLFPPGVWLLFALSSPVAGCCSTRASGGTSSRWESNEQAARLCGISVPRVKFAVYVLGGFFTGWRG